jgi:hypothetical protein
MDSDSDSDSLEVEVEPEFNQENEPIIKYMPEHRWTREMIWNEMLSRRQQFIKMLKNIQLDELNDYRIDLIIENDFRGGRFIYLPYGKFNLFYKNRKKASIGIRFPIIQPSFLQIITNIINKSLVFNIYIEQGSYSDMIRYPWVIPPNPNPKIILEDKPLIKLEFERLLNQNKDNGFKVMNVFLDLLLKFKNVHVFLIFHQTDYLLEKANFHNLFANDFERQFIDPYDIKLYGNLFLYFIAKDEKKLSKESLDQKYLLEKEKFFVSKPSYELKTTLWTLQLLLLTNIKDIRYFIKDIPNKYKKIINDNGGWEKINIYANFPQNPVVKKGESPYDIDLEMPKEDRIIEYTKSVYGYTLTYMIELIFLILHNIRLRNSNYFDRKPFEDTFSNSNKKYWINIIKMLNYFIIIIIQYIQEKLPVEYYKKGLKQDKEQLFISFLEKIKKIKNHDFQNYYDNPTIELLMIYMPLKIFLSRNFNILTLLRQLYDEDEVDKSFMEQYCITINDDAEQIPIVEMVINCENPEEHTYQEILRKKLIEDSQKKKRKREENEEDDENKKRRLQFKIGTNYYHFGKNLFF